MRRSFLLICFLAIISGIQAQNSAYEAYIQRFKDIAIEEMQRTGIPASIKLAQGLIESNAGRSDLARLANNHFGMKCGGDWNGGTYYKKDDDYRNGRLIKSCFRRYSNPEESYVAHSEFLRDPDKAYRYGFLFRLNPTDYRSWAYGLLKAGYATNPRYARLLIKVIEDYQLYRYDKPITDAELVMEKSYLPHILKINDVEYVIAEDGDSPRSLSMDFNVPVNRILKYNEHLYDADQQLNSGTRVYLQRKRSGFRGKKKYHYVKTGETMFSISQQYGIRLKSLYRKNKMEMGTEPAIGERIKLRGWALFSSRPTLRSEKNTILPQAPDKSLEKDEQIEINIPDEKEFDTDSRKELKEEKQKVANPVPYNPYQGKPRYYTVKKGDNLYDISRKYNTTVKKIIKLNKLDGTLIYPGQILRIEP